MLFFPDSVRRHTAFTLIELLIVIAIIAILALIAVPNFMEAQTRAKLSRAKADMRAVSTAMESYMIDNSAYPFTDPKRAHSYLTDIPSLTTPVAHMTALPPDPFAKGGDFREQSYRYYPMDYWKWFYPDVRLSGWMWLVMSNGPNGQINIDQQNAQDAIDGDYWMVYDVTNGTNSFGDIFITNKGFLGTL